MYACFMMQDLPRTGLMMLLTPSLSLAGLNVWADLSGYGNNAITTGTVCICTVPSLLTDVCCLVCRAGGCEGD